MNRNQASGGLTSVRSRLMALSMASILPVVIFAGVLAFSLSKRHKESVEQGLLGTSRALTSAIDQQITNVISSVKILLRTHEEIGSGTELKKLNEKLKNVVSFQENWIGLSYSRSDGTQYLNTGQEFGRPLPSFGGEAFFKEAVETGDVTISGFREALVSKKKVISIAFPVLENGRVKFVLVASIRIEVLSETLKKQNLSENWTSAILDRDSVIIGRSRNSQRYLGTKATKVLAESSRKSSSGIFEDETLEGKASHGAFFQSQLTGWTVVIGIPQEEFLKELRRTYEIIAMGAVVFIGLGLGLAYFMGLLISNPLEALSHEATALGKGQEVRDVDTSLREVHNVVEALKKASFDRDESLKKAQEAIELRDTFLSVASHELKTPITALQLNLQIFQRGFQDQMLNDKLRLSFNRSLNQVKRLTLLVDELLDVSRIASGKMNLNFEEVDLGSLIQETLIQFADYPHDCVITPAIVGTWDKSRLEQVLTNLISNAIKYGNSQPFIIRTESDGKEALIIVKDEGVGIDPKNHQRVFERFERAVHGTTIPGLGLGLWICHQIVREHNGTIHLESNPGKGSTFFVRLPLEPV